MEVIDEDFIDNIDDMMVLISKKIKKFIGGKKFPDNGLIVPLDNVSFHS